MKLKGILSFLLILHLLNADSPITSTDFYKAYLFIPEVEYARESGIITEEIASYLLNPKISLDKKAAVINALSWDFDGKVNRIIFKKYLAKKYPSISNSDSLLKIYSDSELFCLGYLTVMDNYHEPERGVIYFDSVKSSIRDSYTFQIVNALVKAQSILPKFDKWCRIWTHINDVETNKDLNVDMNYRARSIILKYIRLYEEYCIPKGTKKI